MKKVSLVLSALLLAGLTIPFAGCAKSGEKVVTLRVSSWEEYIDLGGWDDDEIIEVENPFTGEDGIIGKNSMVDDFTKWFNENHDYKVKVEYSTFGTNEDLYNRLSLGDTYDLVCPSDYMIMKLIDEGKVVEYSDGFWDLDREENYYANYVSRYIDGAEGEGIYNTFFENPEDNWHKKAACYMWGTSGFVYNPEKLKNERDISSCEILLNPDYKRAVTIKDNVRDAYFATLSIIFNEELNASGSPADYLNKTDSATIAKAEDVLKKIKGNVYSFETDSGKADMVTGKVVANYQWSGDAVYIMDEADADDTELWYSVPEEGSNLWFDGWVMLKDGIQGNEQRQEAAEAFVNFLSRPDNAVRNMYYIGYTSAIADETVFEYMEWNYGDEDGDFEYDSSYFFGTGYTVCTDSENFAFDGEDINRGRQLFAQYPPENVINRSVVMLDFGDKLAEINQMWINVRCPDLKDVDPVIWGVVGGIAGVSVIAICLYVFRYRLFISYRPKKGYEKVEK